MVSREAEALALKAEGNRLFSKKDYVGAESYYSRASVAVSTVFQTQIKYSQASSWTRP
jgi:hypothetical protein